MRKTMIYFRNLILCGSGFWLLMMPFGLKAQEQQAPVPDAKIEPAQAHSFNSLGGEASGHGGSVSYSVGQLVFTNEGSGNGSVAQGVQRSYRLASVETPSSVPVLNFTVLPNPTQDDLFLRLNEKPEEEPMFRLTDIKGGELLKGRIEYPQTRVQMAGLPSGSYLIQVMSSKNQRLQTLEIIKN